MARVTQEEEAFPVGRTPSSSSSPSYTYFHSLLINRFYIYPHCSPNQTSFSLALSHAELWHAAIHAVPFLLSTAALPPFLSPFHSPVGGIHLRPKLQKRRCWCSTPERLSIKKKKKKKKLVLQSNDLIARTTQLLRGSA